MVILIAIKPISNFAESLFSPNSYIPGKYVHKMTVVIQLLAYYLYMGGMIVCSGGLTNSVRNTLVPQAILITTSTLKSEHWASSNMVVFSLLEC